ncbi:MAG: hypothetical protein IKR81_14535 [Victivallales bacterium]|nr:hypothetical protein [Victivallales bacterium]
MLEFGFSREDITPHYGIGLCGYLNPRYNRGAYDRLSLKAVVFKDGDGLAALVEYDLCLLTAKLCRRIEAAVAEALPELAGKTIYAATHTHTGPYTAAIFSDDCTDAAYIDELIQKSVIALRNAKLSLAPAELFATTTQCSTLAFNRRYLMKNGKVLTNPGKLNPDVVKPDGSTDPLIPILALKQEGEIRLLIVNISNHADTIGGDFVSADWPGRMEKEIQYQMGYDVPVISITAPQGNINHFNIATDADQTSYAEACRIGKGYAAAVLAALYQLRKVEFQGISTDSITFEAPYLTVTDEEYAEAKAICEKYKDAAKPDHDLTSEDIAKGTPYVQKYFAEALMGCRDHAPKEKRFEQIASIKFGDAIALVTLPCEPFVEIGQAIREKSRFPLTLLVALGMGEIGYVGLPRNYGNGGYETLPSAGKASQFLGEQMIDYALSVLK